MAQFVLLLHESPAAAPDVSPEQIQKIIADYSAWRDRVEAEGRLVASNKLKDEGGRNLVQKNGSVRVVDGPYSEAKEVVGGYFVIRAADYDEAVEVSKGCPHLIYGGRIELRQLDLVD